MNDLNNQNKVILDAKNISIVFGGLKAVTDFNITIRENELVGLIGPNGAGKTTVFNMLTGVYKPTSGKITLCGEDVTYLSPHVRVEKGISRTFQNIRLFKKLSVSDNIKAAFNTRKNYTVFDAIFRTKRFWKEEKLIDEKTNEILDILGLSDCSEEIAKNLPYGKQRKLEIARALATSPKLILLDEPAAGMNPIETSELMETIKTVREKFNTTILLIEHDMKLVMGICEKITVLSFGEIIASGSPEEIKNNPDVISAYLGE